MIRSTVYWVETAAPGRLGILARPRAGDWLEDEMKALREAGVEVLVSLLTRAEEEELELLDERRCCEAAGMAFVSLPIDDRGTPDSDVEALTLISRLERFVVEGKTVGIHCRMGIGRSSMIAAGVLVRLGVNGERAFERLASSRGLAVPDTEEQRQWVMRLAS
jgi:protein-tyrosine phosphatase